MITFLQFFIHTKSVTSSVACFLSWKMDRAAWIFLTVSSSIFITSSGSWKKIKFLWINKLWNPFYTKEFESTKNNLTSWNFNLNALRENYKEKTTLQ